LKRYFNYITLLILLTAAAAAFSVNAAEPAIDLAKKYSSPTIDMRDGELKDHVESELKQYINSLPDDDYKSPERLLSLSREAIKKILESQGHYRSLVTYTAAENGDLTYHIRRGKPYKISKVSINADETIKLPELSSLQAKIGNKLIAEQVLEDVKTITEYVEKNNCIASLEVTYDAFVDDKKNSAEVLFTIAGINNVYIGDIALDGLESIRHKYIYRNLGLKEGDCYSRANIDKAKIKMYETGLFSNIDIAENYTEGHQADLNISLREKSHRTIKAGAGYNLDEGIFFTTGWEHRNIFHNGEKLTINAKASTILQQLESKLTVPSFVQKNSLTLSADIKQENLDSYKASTFSTGATLQRKFSNKLSISHGPNFRVSTVEKAGVRDEYAFLLYPVIFLLDKRDSVLDPTKGFSLSYEVSPYVNTLDPEDRFVKNIVKGNIYKTFEDTTYTPTLAAKAGVGSIYGLKGNGLPADQRFYAGGGGSVRGYEYQTLGPMLGNEPLGGNSFAEIGVEARLRFNESWGGVMFLDGGEAYAENYPEFGKDMHYAYGVGARYFTSFAPIRFDIAFPLNARQNDAAYQFYISIGQAF
jgi:translocation and assembly module TamA